MNHDEAIGVLKLHRAWFAESCITQALDYAIAQLERNAYRGAYWAEEPKPTQFDERVAKLNKQYGYPFEPMPYRMMASYIASRNNVAEMLTLISDMQAHIQKLEKGQSDGTSGK